MVQVDLTHKGESVGRLVVAQRGPEAFSAADLRLLSDLALPIGAALHAVRLSNDLQRSREQLVLSVEEERRRLGRELHDSLGPSLAAIGMQVETAAGWCTPIPIGPDGCWPTFWTRPSTPCRRPGHWLTTTGHPPSTP